MRFAYSVVFILLMAQVLPAQSAQAVPGALKPPPTEHVVLQTHAMGVQIYRCSKGADGNFAWSLKAPDAELRDANGRTVILHSAGPTWQHKDGSKITGKVAAKADAPQSDSIPWLLLDADHSSSGEGALQHVMHVQRINTSGGQPPTEACTSEKDGVEFHSHYSADYVFFAP